MVAEFFHSRLGLSVTDDFQGVLWIPEQYRLNPASMDDVAAAAGFNAFIGRTCCMHTVIQKPEYVTKRMIRDAFNYAFNIAGVEVVLGLVDSTNKEAIKFDTKLGFVEAHRVMNGGLDGDLVVFEMHKAACRWLKEVKHGQEVRTASA